MAHRVLEKHRHPRYQKLTLELRSSSRYWQARTYADGHLHQKSTEHSELRSALRIAESWYKDLIRSIATAPADVLGSRDDTMQQLFQRYKRTLPAKRRSQADMRWGPIRGYWKTVRLHDVAPKTFHIYYAWRRKRKHGKVTSNSTLHKDLCLIRQILRHACEQGLRDSMPIVPRFGTVARNPRPWLTRDEFDILMHTSQIRMDAAASNPRLLAQRNDLHEFIFFMIESMMRVNEVRELTVGQCRAVESSDKKQGAYLAIDVQGKTGHRTAIAGGHAPTIFDKRSEGLSPGDRLWAHGQRDAFRELLIAAGLRTDAFGITRNLKSLRCTAISLYILRNPNVNLSVVSKNSGTSVQMLEGFYLKRLSAEMHAHELSGSIAG